MTSTSHGRGPRFGSFNRIGCWALYRKEVRRFLKVAAQTVAGPVVTTLLFLAIFAVAFGRARPPLGDIPFLVFLAPGLVMMAIFQNAFANTVSSLLIAKINGTIGDLLMAPLAPGELVAAIALGGATRGLLVGAIVGVAMAPAVGLQPAHPGYILFHAVAGAVMLALLGVIGGVLAQKFDHLGAMTSFVITPLSFLSGTFYSVAQLPEALQGVARLNPFFYMIDGFRYGFIGQADGSLAAGLAATTGLTCALAGLAYALFASGYRLRP
ncbi:MAG: ABC transporter permease [Alphaproteobacteria bacterium]